MSEGQASLGQFTLYARIQAIAERGREAVREQEVTADAE